MHPTPAHGLASLGTMAASVAHEINVPLAYLLLNLEFLHKRLGAGQSSKQGEREATSELADALQHSLDGAHRIRDIVRALSLFSRPDLREIEP